MSSRSALGELRDRNLGLVATAIRETPDITHTELVQKTGLAEGAISLLVNELVSARVLHSESAPASGRGRPRRLLTLDDERPALVGVALHHNAIEIRIAALKGRVLASETVTHPGLWEPGRIGAAIADVVRGSTAVDAPGTSLAIAFPGIQQGGRLSSEEMLWDAESMDDLFSPLAEANVRALHVVNDGDAATLAEHASGAARTADNAVVVMVGSGVGGSAIIHGAMLLNHGATSGFGHTPVARDGPECGCGRRGCLERFASLTALALHLNERPTLESLGPAAYARQLAERAQRAEDAVLDALGDAREKLGVFGDIISAVLGTEILVVTGPASVLTPWLAPSSVGVPPIPVISGDHGSDAPLEGALSEAQRAYLEMPLMFGKTSILTAGPAVASLRHPLASS